MDSIATCMGPIWIRLSQVRIGSGVDRIQSIPIQVGCKRVGSELDWIEPDMDPIWIRLSQARVGYGLNLPQPIPSTGRMQAFGIRHGLAWASPGSDMDLIELGTYRIWIEFDPAHSNPGRMQPFEIRHGFD